MAQQTVAWEHVWLALSWKSGFLGIGGGWDAQMTAKIEELGRAGYELVTAAPVVGAKGAQFILFFKRKVAG